MAKILVLGLGNLLLGDEGVGVHAAQALLQTQMPDEVMVIDVGTAILDAISALEDADFVIVVDAVKADGSPGTIYRIPFTDMIRPDCIASMHGFDLSRVLALAQRQTCPEVLVIGIEPATMDWSLDLSPAVAETFPVVLEQVRREIEVYLQTGTPMIYAESEDPSSTSPES
jgi:hydrogenase maturation protease